MEEPIRFDPNNNEDFIMEDETQATTKEEKVKRNSIKKQIP